MSFHTYTYHDQQVISSKKRALAGGCVSFGTTHHREIDLPSAGVVESATREHGVDMGEAPPVERGRGRLLFAAPLLGGLAQGDSGTDPNIRNQSTDAKHG